MREIVLHVNPSESRALRGELEEAVDVGIKVLKICGALHHDEVMRDIMPSLIQILVLFGVKNLLGF